jgi:hypothetical protein
MSSTELPNKYFCEPCSFSTNDKKDYNRHKLTKKHNKTQNSTIISCLTCNFTTSNTALYERHLMTNKHKKQSLQEVVKYHTCNCGNTYKHRQGLNNHKKKCLLENNTISKKDELAILELCSEIIKQNQLILLETKELRKMFETQKTPSS